MVLGSVGSVRRAVRAALAVAAALVLAAAATLVAPRDDPQVTAFDHSWLLHSCTGVTQNSTQARFLDDAPTGLVNGEGVFVSVNANDETTESCTWWTSSNINLGATILIVEAAVNDGATLRVTAHGAQTCTGSTLATAQFTGATADNRRRALQIEGWDATVVRVCIRLGEAQGSSEQRLSAVVDRIMLWDGTVNVWQETFGRPG